MSASPGLAREGSTCPPAVVEAARAADGVVLGPVSHNDYPPRAEGGINVSGELRIQLDLYVNIRPSRSRAGLPHYGRTPMDLVIVRENTEGFYSDRNMHWGVGEFMPTPDLALSVRKITAQGSRRIARAAFELAMRRPRRRVTAVHKANVIKVSEALFLREVRAVAAEYPDVSYDEQLVDSMAALLVRDARRYDVIVTTNMSATSCRTRPPSCRAASGSRAPSITPIPMAWRRRSMARRPTLPGRTRRTRPP
jgi:3-isopropylmalate dehydrogenase